MLDLFPDSARIEAGELSLGGVASAALADRFGTPLVVYCEDTLRAQARALREAVREEGRVFYGTKAFPNVALLRLLREEGIGADVASTGELAFARAAGLTGAELVVHGNNKDEALLRAAADEKAPVVLDAPDEAERAAAVGVERVLVRVTLGVDADTHEAIVTGHHGSKFGLPPDDARASIADALARGLDVLGLHVHVGSQLPDFTAQSETIRRLVAFAADCRDALGWELRVADLGGGFGIRHHPDDDVPEAAELARAAVATALETFTAAGLPAPGVWLEPGRSLVGRAGVTLYRAAPSSGSPTERGSRSTVGCPTTPAPSCTTRATRRSAPCGRTTSRTRPSAWPGCTASRATSSSTTSRCLLRGAAICSPCPRPGAYTLAMSSNYNGVPRPAAVLVRDGEARVIRRRETVDDLLALEG